MDMQQQLREDLRYQEAEVQRLRDIEGYFQESNEKVKEAPGEGEGGQAGLLCQDSAEEERGWQEVYGGAVGEGGKALLSRKVLSERHGALSFL